MSEAGDNLPPKLAPLAVAPHASIRAVMSVIDQGAKGIALVVDRHGRLLATVTDGDLRRAILADIRLDQPIADVLARKRDSHYPSAITAQSGTSNVDLLSMMRTSHVRHLPIVDEEGTLVDLVALDDLVPGPAHPMRAVVMAGGLGARLGELTRQLPKPMLPIGNRPVLEHIVEQLRQSGVHRVRVATHYLADRIKEHFDDGRRFGVEMEYVQETEPLGTAGALGLLEQFDGPTLVINGDIVTSVDYRAMLAFHQEQQAELTVGVRAFEMEVPYGVIDSDGPVVKRLKEKPSLSFLVNAGIYLLEPSVHADIAAQAKCDMTDLIARLLAQGRMVASFPIVEYWIDVGRPPDYERANQDAHRGSLPS